MRPMLSLLLAALLWLLPGCAKASPQEKGEALWLRETLALRTAGHPYFVEADYLGTVLEWNGETLLLSTIYRDASSQGFVMLGTEAEDQWGLHLGEEVEVWVFPIRESSPVSDARSGSVQDLVEGRVVSLWGAFDGSGEFWADSILVWEIL